MPNPYTLQDFMKGGGMDATDHPLAQQLDFIKKYDPNASIVTQGGGDGGGSSFDKIQYDQSKLPAMKAGYTPNYFLDKDGNDTADHTGFTPRKGATNQNKIYDPNYGWMVPDSDVGQIDEKANNAQQNKEGGLFSTIGNALVPSDKPWMTIPTVIGAGLGSAGLSGLEKAGVQLGMGAVTSGGKNLTDPMTYLGLATGMGVGQLPPEVQRILNLAKMGYGAVKDPVGTAVGLGTGAASSFVGNILKGTK